MNSDTNDRFVVPEVVASHFHLLEGDTVADFGAGGGYFIPTLAAAVGTSGLVYAVEVQKNLAEAIGELIRQKHLENVQIIWGDLEERDGTKIKTDSLDVGILVNTFFQLTDKPAAIAEITRTLRPGGRLFIIDWSESFGGLGPQPGDVVTERDVRALFETAGYTYEMSFPAGSHHYGLLLRTA